MANNRRLAKVGSFVGSTSSDRISFQTNTGIGTTNPTSRLTVDGDVRVTGVVTATTFIGAVNSTGIITAQTFVGNITGTAATFTGNVTIGGTLTYDDVTNVDSLGLITARNGLQVLAGITTISGMTQLTNVNISGIATAVTFNGQINAGVGTITTLTGTSGTITNLSSTNLSGTIGTITTLSGTTGTITNLTSTNLSGTIGTITTLSSTNGTVTNLSGTIGTITTLSGTTGTITNLSSTNLSGTIGTITTLNSTNGTVTNLSGTIGTITTLSGTTGTITNLTSTNLSGTIGTIATLNSTSLVPTNINSSGITTLARLGVSGVTTTQHLNVSGVSTFVSVGATTLNVTGVVTASGGIQGIGIFSGGNAITTGIITALNFIGTGNTFLVTGNRVDISISGSSGGSTVGGGGTWTTNSSGINTSKNVGIGTTNSISLLSLGSEVGIDTNTTTIATTTATSIVGIATTAFRSARIQVQITQSTNYQASDILMIHNGTTSTIVEYGSIATNDYLGNFSTDVNSGNARLLLAMNSATSATVKVLAHKMTV